MSRGLFVTGTDTGVGKTVVCAALLDRYGGTVPLGYWKPVQTGIEQDDDVLEVRRLAGCQTAEGIRLPHPVSPHLAARWCGRRIGLEELSLPADTVEIPITDRSLTVAARDEGLSEPRPPGSGPADAGQSATGFHHRLSSWIVEGAGGVLVPLNETDLMADLMRALALPVVVVARTTLGTINHTLLTLEALRSRSLRVAGVVMAGHPNRDNRAAIEHYGGVPVLGEMPHFDPLEPGRLAAWATTELDPAGSLLDFLR